MNISVLLEPLRGHSLPPGQVEIPQPAPDVVPNIPTPHPVQTPDTPPELAPEMPPEVVEPVPIA